jgi:hypothetical protein
MTAYHIFFIDPQNHVSRPAEVIECADDNEAIKETRKFIDGQDIELWHEARFIVRFRSESA